jgi:HD domain
MTVHGYSDRINHALAFAAKHNDREVRKGTRLPYGTRAANVAVILTKYGQDEDTVVGGILHDVVEDWLRDRYTREMLEQRIADKFGLPALDVATAVAMRPMDDEGVELSAEERRGDFLARLNGASDRACWVCAATAIHRACTILADLRRTIDPDSVWGRFHSGKQGTILWYRRLYDGLRSRGFSAPIMEELAHVVETLERHQQPHASSAPI